ncbi:hypothetical protein CDAR_266371 [Caerostris darwini]|uniref:Uncharacterized protein n=1 Tax=Caerostris darwini TaxID=1538125 RepID=A0AAV4Q4U0_9ARAC|nr:hypothetical protein CDAR_266371 [Caerostris darwini]
MQLVLLFPYDVTSHQGIPVKSTVKVAQRGVPLRCLRNLAAERCTPRQNRRLPRLINPKTTELDTTVKSWIIPSKNALSKSQGGTL